MTNNRDASAIEYREIQEQMHGISPKLELYKRLQKRLYELHEKLEGGVPITKRYQGQKGRGKNKKYTSRYQSF